MTKDNELDHLSERTPIGVFRNTLGIHLWVFNSFSGKIALQLEPTDTRPAFSYHKLDIIPVTSGEWLGSARVQAGKFNAIASRGVGGVLCLYRGQMFVKVSSPTGASERLVINGYHPQAYAHTSRYCEFWQLELLTSRLPESDIPMLTPAPLAPYDWRQRGVFSEPTRISKP